jgi:hypothetical protein
MIQTTPNLFKVYYCRLLWYQSKCRELCSSDNCLAIFTGWLKIGDILVLDNATIHYGGDTSDLGNWLWINFRIFLLFLPARTPERIQIEIVWNILVQRLEHFCLGLENELACVA